MDGSGISVEKESDAIKECYKSLKKNNFLNLKNSFGLTVRVTFFLLRKLMISIGLGGLLRNLKKKKHSFNRIAKL